MPLSNGRSSQADAAGRERRRCLSADVNCDKALASRRVNQRLVWWRCPGLNGGPAAYESAALPTELHRQKGWYESGDMIQECSRECLARIIHEGSSRMPVRTGWLLRSVWFVSFVWLNQTSSDELNNPR